ncbi:MAG: hypothetical protein MR738_18375 [Enterocloster clostridioformis]|uniref:hypothetical protein n=1 Tax=Enterocloster clostridioformis TaxID=1531 RepID=UPI0024319B29|nr:hypothetical protein [Enterocloster clostridioformis]MCI6128023.1 hypothetical protein [Enterocloster clostridioformis]MDY4763529.1 hypothetical protein [Enterocloster clostridioformis]
MENKENVTIIDIDNALFDIEVLAEKVQVMVDDVKQGYFDFDIEKNRRNVEDSTAILYHGQYQDQYRK